MFGVNQTTIHPLLLSISCVCCSVRANPSKLLYDKVSLLKSIIKSGTVQRQYMSQFNPFDGPDENANSIRTITAFSNAATTA